MTGECESKRCICHAAWTGLSCEHLHLLPAHRSALYPVGGHPTSLPSTRSFPWGGTIAKEAGKSKYHLFVAEWANHRPMTYATWPAQVDVRHAISTSPNGPWTSREVVLTGAGNPVYALAHDGTHLIFFTGVPQPISGCSPSAQLQRRYEQHAAHTERPSVPWLLQSQLAWRILSRRRRHQSRSQPKP